ncbi:CynX/NimT family MFS transporter [Virgibacillus sp. YIM 98842]|uniref:CynX/NimT family MFS transporter n=1 Tax=Virgibacillus sp. YIM 98842 TaxID=2663533 RepID=UPI0013DBEF0C|nr:CynX/NimT family MFS transporter [Virgibacillus sp. YIM 98842]
MNITAKIKRNKLAGWGMLIGVLLIAANLRAPLTSIGALLPYIRDDLAISHTAAGSLTTLPLLAFAAVSPFGYLIAAIGPVLLGFIHDISGNWIFPLLIVGMIGVILVVTGLKAGANNKIADRSPLT